MKFYGTSGRGVAQHPISLCNDGDALCKSISINELVLLLLKLWHSSLLSFVVLNFGFMAFFIPTLRLGRLPWKSLYSEGNNDDIYHFAVQLICALHHLPYRRTRIH